MQPTPSSLVASQPKCSLQSQSITTIFLIRDMPNCQKPHTQGFTSTFKYGSSCYRCLPLTICTTNLMSRCQPALGTVTRRTNKPIWPTKPEQVRLTGFIIWKPFIKFLYCSWIINATNWMARIKYVAHAVIIQLRERNGYPPHEKLCAVFEENGLE